MISEERLKELAELLKIPQAEHPERLFAERRIKDTDLVVYDLGCGRHKTIPRAIGVDIKRVTDIRASIDCLPMIECGTVDVVISRHSLEHLIDPVKALREWYRILKPFGRIILVLPDHEFIDTMDYRTGNGVHLHAYTRSSLANLVDALGLFVILEDATVISGWTFGMVIEKGEQNDKQTH